MPRRLNLVNLVNLVNLLRSISMARKQCQVCGQPATVRVEANLNGRHSTMLLCDDHYRQLVRQQKRTVSPLEALFGSRSAPVRGLPRQ